MKQQKRAIAISLSSALCMVLMGSTVESRQAKNPEAMRRGIAGMSNKASDNINAQWLADPKRGWVPADEAHGKYRANKFTPKDKSGSKVQELRKESRDKKRR